jgi:enoyl-CoA hydratase/carnithine racemase
MGEATPAGGGPVLVDRDGDVVTVTLNRPRRKNAIDAEMFVELRRIFRELGTGQAARCIVLTGAGDAFCSGADLSGAATPRPDGVRPSTLWSMRDIGETVSALARIPVPVIAKVNGVAAGAGMSFALACDLVVAADTARFGAVFAKRGLSIDCGASWLLPRLVGMHTAKEIALLGELFDAATARSLGLVNRVVDASALDAEVAELAARLASGPTTALSLTKRMLNQSFDVSLDEALEAEAMAQAVNGATHDTREGMMAFLEKRNPSFIGH